MTISRMLLALAFLAGCQTAPADPPAAQDMTMTFRILHSGAYGVAASAEPGTAREARVAVASTENEYETLWRAHVGDAPRPAVDFARESAIFLLLGQRTTGGWSVAPESVTIRGDAADVTAAIGRPEPGGVTTMAFSAPYAVIAVSRPGLDGATWKGPGGNVVASAAEPPR
ncbi:MAG TPA: protease complex subunit PrcB family protein [Thermoanaerobaculia bacterium]|nr:protease complex subunit PrcB family protein [Thermoanaerobaculia bacterium]